MIFDFPYSEVPAAFVLKSTDPNLINLQLLTCGCDLDPISHVLTPEDRTSIWILIERYKRPLLLLSYVDSVYEAIVRADSLVGGRLVFLSEGLAPPGDPELVKDVVRVLDELAPDRHFMMHLDPVRLVPKLFKKVFDPFEEALMFTPELPVGQQAINGENDGRYEN